jgi:glycosyltransferase involved in cell wall biosynthesis
VPTPNPAKPLHIVLLNQAFYPDVVATAQMGKDLADSLVRRGHKVTAVASRSIYGKSGAVLAKSEDVAVDLNPKRERGITSPGPIDAASRSAAPTPDTLADAPGSGRATIHIRRVGASLFGKASIAARILDFALFYLLATLKVLLLKKPDVIICYTTPPFIALVGLLCKWLRGSRAIYWVMDLYPDLPIACGVMNEKALPTRLFERLNRFLLKHSDVDVVLGRCMQDRVLRKGTPAGKVVHIPVWSDLAPPPSPSEPSSHAAPTPNPFRQLWNPTNACLVMYSGNFGLGHDAATICDAMLRLKDESDIRFVFVGGGKRRTEVESFIARHGLTNATYRDYVPREQLNDSLAAADLHLISLKEGVEGIMVPSKLFGIMATARPSIFLGNPTSEIARVLSESDSGLTVREGDGEALARAIRELAHDPRRRAEMGQRAAAALRGRYDMQTACATWCALVERAAARTA